MLQSNTCKGDVWLTEFGHGLSVPELVLVLCGLVYVFGWTLTGGQELHSSLNVLQFLHGNGRVLWQEQIEISFLFFNKTTLWHYKVSALYKAETLISWESEAESDLVPPELGFSFFLFCFFFFFFAPRSHPGLLNKITPFKCQINLTNNAYNRF